MISARGAIVCQWFVSDRGLLVGSADGEWLAGREALGSIRGKLRWFRADEVFGHQQAHHGREGDAAVHHELIQPGDLRFEANDGMSILRHRSNSEPRPFRANAPQSGQNGRRVVDGKLAQWIRNVDRFFRLGTLIIVITMKQQARAAIGVRVGLGRVHDGLEHDWRRFRNDKKSGLAPDRKIDRRHRRDPGCVRPSSVDDHVGRQGLAAGQLHRVNRSLWSVQPNDDVVDEPGCVTSDGGSNRAVGKPDSIDPAFVGCLEDFLNAIRIDEEIGFHLPHYSFG